MIYTVTFNPSVDYIVHTGVLNFGQTNRTTEEEIQFGGKGINVSRVLNTLGIKSTALGFIAGFTGDALESALKENGIKTDFIKLQNGHTRINIKLKHTYETEINAQGPQISDEAVKLLFSKLGELQSGDTLVLSGSVPKNIPDDIYEHILADLDGKGIRFVVDASGNLLKNTLKYKPFLIKPNRAELEEIAEMPLENDSDIQTAARLLSQLGAQNVLVSLGADGALLLDEYGKPHRQAALGGKPVNTVGAGDSMVAGFLAGIDGGYEYALRLGVAAGGACACSSGLADKDNITKLMQKRPF